MADSKGTLALNESTSVRNVRNIADAIGVPPADLGLTYLGNCARAAALLGNPSDAAARAMAGPQTVGTVSIGGFSSAAFAAAIASDLVRNGAMDARNRVFDVMNRVNAFCSRATNAGFIPPDNPFLEISRLSKSRAAGMELVVDVTTARSIELNIGAYLDLIRAEAEGKINLGGTANSVQLSSVSISFEGYGGSGNPAVDLLSFVPDADAIKANRAAQALSVLDFRKRTPKALFSVSYNVGGFSSGNVVGWRRVPDASGYILKRRNVFTSEETSFTFSNDELRSKYDQVIDYVKSWVLCFYDTIDPGSIFAVLDSTLQPNAYYVYRVQCYQITNQLKGSVFSVDSTAVNMTGVQRDSVRERMRQFASQASSSPDAVSPYPFLAESMLGNSQYDWLLAGTNVRASIGRGDDRSLTRQYSYLAGQLEFVFSQMDRQLFVVPNNVNEIVGNINSEIGQFGVTQVIQEILQETGITFFFNGRDSIEDVHFDRVGTIGVGDSGIVSTVAAAIDPETATLDLRSLASNMSVLLGTTTPDFSTKILQPAGSSPVPRIQSVPTEITVPVEFNSVNDGRAEDPVQFLSALGDIDTDVADLTTFDGISKMIRTIRIFSDLGPNRGAPPFSPIVIAQPKLF